MPNASDVGKVRQPGRNIYKEFIIALNLDWLDPIGSAQSSQRFDPACCSVNAQLPGATSWAWSENVRVIAAGKSPNRLVAMGIVYITRRIVVRGDENAAWVHLYSPLLVHVLDDG